MTNGIKDSVEALRIYRLKDLSRSPFGNLKEGLSMRRMSVASEENFEGKLFVQFVALQLISYIKKQMDEHGLFSDYTMHDDSCNIRTRFLNYPDMRSSIIRTSILETYGQLFLKYADSYS